jgi:hypothetical protein
MEPRNRMREIFTSGSVGRQSNTTHNPCTVRVYYRWHPFYDKLLDVVSIQRKGGELFYTVRIPDSIFNRLIPSWITDKLYCQKLIQKDEPYCSLESLAELREILDILLQKV